MLRARNVVRDRNIWVITLIFTNTQLLNKKENSDHSKQLQLEMRFSPHFVDINEFLPDTGYSLFWLPYLPIYIGSNMSMCIWFSNNIWIDVLFIGFMIFDEGDVFRWLSLHKWTIFFHNEAWFSWDICWFLTFYACKTIDFPNLILGFILTQIVITMF